MRRFRLAVLLLSAVLVAPSLVAAGGLYVTTKLEGPAPEIDLGGDAFELVADGGEDTWAAGLGYRFGEHLAVQFEYHDLGAGEAPVPPCGPPESLCLSIGGTLVGESSALSLVALPTLPLGERVALYGKVGYLERRTEITHEGRKFLDDLEEEGVLLGAGVRFVLPGPVDGFAEFERIEDSFDTASVGVTISF